MTALPPRDPYRLLREHTPGGDPSAPEAWFFEHYRSAPQRVVDVLADAGVPLAGRRVADVGCGDGIIDLGLFALAAPEALIGYDIQPTDVAALEREARTYGVIGSALPSGLRFESCDPHAVPADDAAFDVVVTWSTFEHVREPLSMLREIRRILRPGGHLFLQIWPMYHSGHGAHLWPWYPEGFPTLLHSDDAIAERLATAGIGDQAESDFLLAESRELNRMTVDDLQRVLLAAGLIPTWVQLDAEDVHIPLELATHRLLDLGISGVTLVAQVDR